MEKSSQIAWKIVPLRHFFPLKVVPHIEVLLYTRRALEIPEWSFSVGKFDFESLRVQSLGAGVSCERTDHIQNLEMSFRKSRYTLNDFEFRFPVDIR
jgi:hypothetical protein